MANVFGDKWSFTSFGESHGAAVGGVLDGVPAGLHIDFEMIREELERRAGKGNKGVSPRALREPDEVEWLSGVMESDEVTKDKGQRGLITPTSRNTASGTGGVAAELPPARPPDA